MEVVAIDGYVARCSAQGVERDVSLFLLQDEPAAVGDFVMVHVGYAIQKMTPQEARSTWELFDQVLAAEQAENADRTEETGRAKDHA
jgi:hydrogenase expression/formation protein HypC